LSLTAVLFEDERLFIHLTGRRYATAALNAGWIQQLSGLVESGLRNITPLFAQACYVTKSGLLLAVQDDQDAPAVEPPSLPSAACLAGNPVGPHPISGAGERRAEGLPTLGEAAAQHLDGLLQEADDSGDKRRAVLPEDYDDGQQVSPAVQGSGGRAASACGEGAAERDPHSPPVSRSDPGSGVASEAVAKPGSRTSVRRRKAFE
jgi:hypothetical protein